MALDARLLEGAESGNGDFRTYQWDGPWVSLGRFQTPQRALPSEWDRWCLRPTGGRAVLHGHDVTLAYAVTLEDGVSRSVRDVYRRLISPLVQALRECGLDARLAEETLYVDGQSKTSEDCFALRSPNDVVSERTGKKLCGCALRVTERAALLQASIPVGEPLVDPASVIVGGQEWTAEPWDWASFEEAFIAARTSR